MASALSATPQAISLIPIGRFLEHPPPGITVTSNPDVPLSFTIRIDRKRAYFATSRAYTTQGVKKHLRFVDNCGQVFRITTEEGWKNVTRAILARPLYLMCRCKVQTDEDYNPLLRETTRYYTTADYVVRLETQTEPVRRCLREIFDAALERIRKGQKYSMKIELSQSIGTWFEMHRAETYACGGTRQFDNAYIALTNSSLPCFHACSYNDDPIGCCSVAIFCFPCLLLCGMPYYIFRKCRYVDTKHQVLGEVKISAGGPPLQSGTPRPRQQAAASTPAKGRVKKAAAPTRASAPKAELKTRKDESQQPLLQKDPGDLEA